MGNNESREPRHPIGVVSSRTGLPQDVLRAWERRYEAVSPGRTDTGRRLYSDDDIEKLRLLRQAVESGRRISDVAGLGLGDLRSLVREDSEAQANSRRVARRRKTASPDDYVEEGFEAIRGLDGPRLGRVLDEASRALSRSDLHERVIVPLLRRTGDGWRSGTLRIVNEHLASSVFRSFLGRLRWPEPSLNGRPRMVVTTVSGQAHELGALLAAATAVDCGWDAIYLGPSLPAEEIAEAAARSEAGVIGLSLVYPAIDARVSEELRNLRHYVGPDVTILVGGSAAPAYEDSLREIDARLIHDLDGLRDFLAHGSG
jgi:methylmalonyl-CoA mutase cobalamin-binding domain/chain